MPCYQHPHPPGTVIDFSITGVTLPPPDWLSCDGSEISREDFPQLFLAIRTIYGEGDGVETFNLPLIADKIIRAEL